MLLPTWNQQAEEGTFRLPVLRLEMTRLTFGFAQVERCVALGTGALPLGGRRLAGAVGRGRARGRASVADLAALVAGTDAPPHRRRLFGLAGPRRRSLSNRHLASRYGKPSDLE